MVARALSLLVAAIVLSKAALADAGHVLNYSLGATLIQDSNIFRLAPGVDPQTAIGASDRGDMLTTTTAGLSAEKEIGLQRLKLDMQLSQSRYRKFRRLDNDGHSVVANWSWAVGSRLHGELSSSRRTALSGFAQTASTTRNLNTATTHSASLYLKLAADWEAFGVAGNNTSANSAVENQAASYQSHTTEGGLRYTSPAGHQLSVLQRQVRSALVREDSLIANGTWAYSAMTQLSGSLGRLRRHVDAGTVPDSSGAIGTLNLNWAPLAKTRFNLALRQEIIPALTDYATSTSVRGAALGVTWTPTAKTTLLFSRERSVTLYSSDPAVTTIPREDRLRGGSLSLSYQPERALALTVGLRDESRDSSQSAFGYRDRQGTFSAQFSF